MKTYSTLREKFNNGVEKFANKFYDGLGDTLTTEITPEGLAGVVATAIIVTTAPGCITTTSTTNLANGIKGDKVITAKYNTERFSMDGKTEYVINAVPKTFELPDGTSITTDSILKMKDVIANSYLDTNHIIFKQKEKKDIYAVVPVNFSKNGRNLYLVNPNNDKKDVIILPSKFNMSERKIPEGFNVEKVKTDPVNINQTLHLPEMGEVYAFIGKFPVYSTQSLKKRTTREPVIIMPIEGSAAREDYTDNTRGLEGKLHAIVKLPTTKITKKQPVTADTIAIGKTHYQQNAIKGHTVIKGDTLYKIAKKHNITLNNLRILNPQLANRKNNLIYPNEKLKISK